MSRALQHLGDIKKQGLWIIMATSAAAGLQLFSIIGPTGELLYDLFKRIIINYQTLFSYIWKQIGNALNVNLSIYKDQLTLSSLILAPYAIRMKHVRFDSILNDDNKLLSYLNLICIIFISTSISRELSSPHRMETWSFAVSMLPFSLIFMYMSWNSKNHEIEYPIIRDIIFIISLLISSISISIIIYHYGNILSIFQPKTTLLCHILYSTSYMIAMLFKINGRYPFLYIVLFYFTIYILNYFSMEIYPAANSWLISIGA